MNKDIVNETIEFIRLAHEGQFYGEDHYFLHPIAVADNIPNATETEYLAALLHDVVEDTDNTIDSIAAGWSAEVAYVVSLVTKDNSLSYEENISRIIDSGNVSAMRVKLSDNQINYAGDKNHMKPERAERLSKKYSISMERLVVAIFATT